MSRLSLAQAKDLWRRAISEKGWEGSTLEKVMFDWPPGKPTRYHPNPPAFDSIADTEKTIDEGEYQDLLDDLLRRGQRYSEMGSGRTQLSEIDEVEKAVEATFGLERDLQKALRANIGQLEAGLRIVDDGKERPVESGRIDITAEDDRGATVVIELKAGEADRDAIGQILSYMGDLVQTDKPLRGILVAGGFSSRAISAARAVKNLQLKKYSFRFSFDGIGK